MCTAHLWQDCGWRTSKQASERIWIVCLGLWCLTLGLRDLNLLSWPNCRLLLRQLRLPSVCLIRLAATCTALKFQKSSLSSPIF